MVNLEQARRFCHDMTLARAFEEAGAEQYTQGRVGGFLHLYPGEEAVTIGVGCWLRMTEQTDAVFCFFGDGAANQETFHASLNMAVLRKLPVLFICENNHHQISTEIIGTLIAVYGVLVDPILGIWAYALAWFLFNGLVKVST